MAALERKIIAGVVLALLVAGPALAVPPARKTVRKAAPAARPVAPAPAAKPAEAPPPPAPEPAGTKAEPIGRVADWFPPDAYPTQARAKGQEGLTVFALDLDARGRITGCNIVQTSGSDLLDSTTCTQLITNGRFKPARDAAGKPVPGRYQSSMRWKLVEGAAVEE
ncbi:energy transducer TonB [Sphingomonas sp.]|uniref:energy transducer TonB n=1 Tax=Sphingomonas sp. TaxID=28214 RepID=UPI001E0AF5A7|nr:energy transducer TonB [Sphingomonas sp.]MBX9797573.1 energy transducer TonB [Sphingomonas sp.]